jgi:hypothetical protein
MGELAADRNGGDGAGGGSGGVDHGDDGWRGGHGRGRRVRVGRGQVGTQHCGPPGGVNGWSWIGRGDDNQRRVGEGRALGPGGGTWRGLDGALGSRRWVRRARRGGIGSTRRRLLGAPGVALSATVRRGGGGRTWRRVREGGRRLAAGGGRERGRRLGGREVGWGPAARKKTLNLAL